MTDPPFPFTESVTVTFRDLDFFGHVNNAVYFSYFENVRIRFLLHLMGETDITRLPAIVAENSVRYLKPVFFGEQLSAGVRVTYLGTRSLTLDSALTRPGGEVVATNRTAVVWYDYAAGRSATIPQPVRDAIRQAQQLLPPAPPKN
ncbi:MAG: thioesterase family protein [Herpetosiphon sp.]